MKTIRNSSLWRYGVAVLATGVVLVACALGLAGGLLPAMRAARANIAEVLHET